MQGGGLVNLADSELCMKVDAAQAKNPCKEGNTIWMGKCWAADDNKFELDSNGHLVSEQCANMCAVPATHAPVFVYSSAAVALGDCKTGAPFTFGKVN